MKSAAERIDMFLTEINGITFSYVMDDKNGEFMRKICKIIGVLMADTKRDLLIAKDCNNISYVFDIVRSLEKLTELLKFIDDATKLKEGIISGKPRDVKEAYKYEK